jgi:hypothetical protein
MRALLLIACALLIGTQAADARHYHWYHFRYRYSGHTGAHTAPALLGAARSDHANTRILGRPFPPADWQLQPPVDPKQKGRSYVAPDGQASLTFSATPADRERVSAHLKAVAFVDGEDVLTLAGNREGLLVTGTKGDRMFMRKVGLACGGREWHQVAIEFPAAARQGYERLSAQAVRVLDLADADGCTEPIAGNQP